MPVMPGTLTPSHFSLDFSIRPNVMAFPKYHTPTSDHEKARSHVCLDANENSAGSCLVSAPRREPRVNDTNGINDTHTNNIPEQFISLESLHRYPSASQASLRQRIVQWRNLDCMC
jgi:histidinol-phosphate aminotransferase